MTMDETVSIIIPAYNAEKYLVQSLDSVRAQTYTDYEVLLVLDGCTDGSAQIAEQYQSNNANMKMRLFYTEHNIGAASARNLALSKATGRYIAYLDADDIWRKDKLTDELDFMHKENAAFVFTGYEFADEFGQGTGKVVKIPKLLTYRAALKNTTIFTSTVMFDTQKIPKALLEMPLIKSEDTALWWKVLRQGYRAHGLDENLTWYRRPQTSLSSNKLSAISRIWNLYRQAELLSVPRSCVYFCVWALRATLRRM
ncbi:MAG: glycosyltransferase [Lachnospiraceae bacterium]|nr:glycosyltransferase [Lachnospiraceae bacterium]